MISKLLLITGMLALTGCFPISDQIANNEFKGIQYTNNEFNYHISFPKQITESGTWLNSSTNQSGPFFGSSIDRSLDPPFGRRKINIEIHHISSKCSPSLTGINKAKKETMDGVEIITGKVDYLDTWDTYNGSPDPLCKPIDIKYAPNTDIAVDTYSPTYALCSLKNNKTILICINQMTDNPQLAEDIFKTFRWLEE